MKFLLVATMALLGTAALAANDFETTVGGPDFDRGVFVSPTQDGGYIAVGVTKSFGEGEEDVYLVKTDAQGEVLWSQTYGGPEPDFGWSVHETADGFVLAGFTESFGNGDSDCYLIKTDPAGKMLWSQTYGGEGSDICWALELTTDGGMVLAGETTSSGEGEEDFFLVKTDSLGTVEWTQTFGWGNSDRCFSIVQADDGGYVLAGQTYSLGAGDRDVCVVKATAKGDMEWAKVFGGPESDVGHSVISVGDGHFLVTGYSGSAPAKDDDPYLIKIDSTGGAVFAEKIHLDGVNHTLTGAQSDDRGFYLVGFTQYPGKRGKTGLLVKTDADGHLLWHRDIQPENPGESFGYTVRATADGGCVFTGHTSLNSAGGFDMLLVGVEGDDRETR